MSYLDPYGSTEPRGGERPAGPYGRRRPDRGEEARPRARHVGAAPEAFADHPGYTPVQPYLDGGRPRENGHAGDAYEGSGEHDSNGSGNGRSGYLHDDDGAGEKNPSGWPPVDPDPPVRRPRAGRARAGRRRAGRRRAGRGRPATQSRKAGRAGRNLPAAIGVGVGLGLLIVVPLFLLRPAFLAVIAGAVAVGIWEVVRAVNRSGAYPPLVPLIGGGLLMVGLAWWDGPDALALGLLVTMLATMVWRLGDGPAGYQRDVTTAALVAVYVPFLGGFAALLAAPSDGDLRVLVTMVAVVLSDTGGYGAGVWLGRHPMAPSVSPKKSWEGLGGSVLAAAIGSALLLSQLFHVAPWWGALFGVAVSGAAVLGDLAESMIKRDLGVKDMSHLLPGHGGLMDRLDSVLFAVPTAYLLLAIFVPTR